MMEELFRLTEDVKDLLDTDRAERLAQLLAESHPADVSRALRELPGGQETTAFPLLSREQAGSVLHEMDDQTLLELVRALDEVELSGILEQMPTDNAAQVVDELSEEQAEKVLDLMKEEKSEEVQELLEYGEKTAGRIMSPEFVAVHEEMSVAQALDHVRKSASSEHAFYLYVVDDHDHLVGVVPLRRLITADPATPIRLTRHEDVVSVTPETDQEEAARLVAKYNLLAVPVVDGDRRLLGTVTVDDVIDVIQQEATEDIRSLATLAVFMPIVASMGGIGTTQTATVVVRGIALGDMTASVLLRVLRKEVTLGLTTGAANGVVMAVIAYIWKGQLLLSLILGVALIFNMVVAAVVGTLVPLALKTFRLDPAIASSVIITTFTDVFGFFSFLGLATLLMKFLL